MMPKGIIKDQSTFIFRSYEESSTTNRFGLMQLAASILTGRKLTLWVTSYLHQQLLNIEALASMFSC